jgi:hypothetical protein
MRERRRSVHLRRTVLVLAGCLPSLPPLERRVLVLRAAPRRDRPRSRAQVAQKLDTSPGRVARIERRGVRLLHRYDRTTACQSSPSPFAGGPGGSTVLAGYGTTSSSSGAGTASAGATISSPTGTTPSSGHGDPSSGGSRGGVKGRSAQHPAATIPGLRIGPSAGSSVWLLVVGLLVGATAVIAGAEGWQRLQRRRREDLYG